MMLFVVLRFAHVVLFRVHNVFVGGRVMSTSKGGGMTKIMREILN